jgi:hypothetical protein
MIYKKVVIENTEPWPSQQPSCRCYSHNKGRIIAYEDKLFCGTCGLAYRDASCVGLVLIQDVKL